MTKRYRRAQNAHYTYIHTFIQIATTNNDNDGQNISTLSKDFSSSSNSSFVPSCIFLFYPPSPPSSACFCVCMCVCVFISRFTRFLQKCSQYASAYTCKQMHMNCNSQNLYLRSTTLGTFECIEEDEKNDRMELKRCAHTNTHTLSKKIIK